MQSNFSTRQIEGNYNEKEDKDKDKECCVCMERCPTHVLVPCGHKCVCEECAPRFLMKECPICRKVVATIIKVFDV